jgi:hypothetical protein
MSKKEIHFKMATHTLHKIPLAQSPLSAGEGSFIGNDFDEVDLNFYLTGDKPERSLAYPVTGDSNDPTIPHGSLVTVDRDIQPMTGDTIAFLLNGLFHVKLFEQKESYLRLISPNAKYEPKEVHETDNFQVLGVVTGCCRLIPRRQTIRSNPVHHFQEVSPVNGRIKAVMADQHGNEVHLNLAREEVIQGIKMATIALTNRVLRFGSNSD